MQNLNKKIVGINQLTDEVLKREIISLVEDGDVEEIEVMSEGRIDVVSKTGLRPLIVSGFKRYGFEVAWINLATAGTNVLLSVTFKRN